VNGEGETQLASARAVLPSSKNRVVALKRSVDIRIGHCDEIDLRNVFVPYAVELTTTVPATD
jgi:hypothetical protein